MQHNPARGQHQRRRFLAVLAVAAFAAFPMFGARADTLPPNTPSNEASATSEDDPAYATDFAGKACNRSDVFGDTVTSMKHYLQCKGIHYQVVDEVSNPTTVTISTDSPDGTTSSTTIPAPTDHEGTDSPSDTPTNSTDPYLPGAYDAAPPSDVDMLPNSGGPSCTWLMHHVAKLCYHSGGIPEAMCYKWVAGSYYQWHCKLVAAYKLVNDQKLKDYVFSHFSWADAGKKCGMGAATEGGAATIFKLAGGEVGIIASAGVGCVAGVLDYIFGG